MASACVWPPHPLIWQLHLRWIFKSVLVLSLQLKIKFLLFSLMLGEGSLQMSCLLSPKQKRFLPVWNIARTTFSAFLFLSSPPRFCKGTLKPTSAMKWICPRDIFYPEKTRTPLRTEELLFAELSYCYLGLMDCQSILPETEMLIGPSACWDGGLTLPCLA